MALYKVVRGVVLRKATDDGPKLYRETEEIQCKHS
jgi:hypothetical protein